MKTYLQRPLKSLYCIVPIFLFGCTSSSDSDGIVEEQLPEKQIQLLKVSEVILLGDEVFSEGYIEFTYGSNGFATMITASGGFSDEFTYNDADEITGVFHTNSDDTTYSISYTYTNDLISSANYDNGEVTNFTYQSNGLLIGLDGALFTYDQNGNITTIIINDEVTDSFLYDNQSNPFLLPYPLAYQKINRISKNNVTYRAFGERNITYAYNADGYPIKSVYIDIGGFIKTREYSYN
ncbi:MAG: hypothetical protein WBG90_02635 [Saonia sp.]